MTSERVHTDAELGATKPPAHLIGYTDRFSAMPGQNLRVMLSSDERSGTVSLVRLLHGDERSSVGLLEELVEEVAPREVALVPQATFVGSFCIVEADSDLTASSRLSGHLYAFPTRLASRQGLMLQTDADGGTVWGLSLSTSGGLALAWTDDRGGQHELVLPDAAAEHAWHVFGFSLDWASGSCSVWASQLSGSSAFQVRSQESNSFATGMALPEAGALLVGAGRLIERDGEPRAGEVFNGKIEGPVIVASLLDAETRGAIARHREPGLAPQSVVLQLDMSQPFDGWDVADVSSRPKRARLINAPTRAVTSWSWDGSIVSPIDRPDMFAAVHFHDDDMHHADWRPTLEVDLPMDVPSGVYAIRTVTGSAVDRIPIVVRPRDGSHRKVLLVLPSFTYAAYANERKCQRGKPVGTHSPEQSPYDKLLDSFPEWGLSVYDRHSDGSGVCISSLSRPIPNLRPDYRAGLVNGPRHLAADLYLVHWLTQLGEPFDVVADEDVHASGLDLLGLYRVVITGSHPEYWTEEGLAALRAFTHNGGRLMYMGGNGFYWVTSAEPGTVETTVEVRREHGGTRTWDSGPGESHHQFSGQYGGLWRFRGKGPHKIVGVGFVGEGWDGRNRPYERTPASYGEQFAWAFDDIPGEWIADHGLIMGAGGGDEVDSKNDLLGTPAEAVVLARASGFGDSYGNAFEDVTDSADRATPSGEISADLTFVPVSDGGAVFSVGSIAWASSLSSADYANSAAALCGNVLRTFLSDGSPWLHVESRSSVNDR